METDFAQPGVEPAVHSAIESHSVSAITTKNPTAESQHAISSTVLVQSCHGETGNFRFLALPLELRREIYHYYFVTIFKDFKSIYHLIEKDKNCNIYCLTQCGTQILTVNRQIHSEAQDILYSDSTWHFSFNSLAAKKYPEVASNASLQAFHSRPEFRLIQHITVGVMFHVASDKAGWTSENTIRLEVNRKLLNFICETLLQAPKLLSLKLLWHDRFEHGHLEEKRDCLAALARLPETVKCSIFLGSEASIVHNLHRSPTAESPSAQDYAVKADLNRYLKKVREQHQALSQRDEATEFFPQRHQIIFCPSHIRPEKRSVPRLPKRKIRSRAREIDAQISHA